MGVGNVYIKLRVEPGLIYIPWTAPGFEFNAINPKSKGSHLFTIIINFRNNANCF